MRYLCDTCKSNPLYLIDHSKAAMVVTCTVCKEPIKFSRILFIDYFHVSRNKILELTRDLEFINQVKAELKWNDKMTTLMRDIAYHNLYVTIALKIKSQRIAKNDLKLQEQ